MNKLKILNLDSTQEFKSFQDDDNFYIEGYASTTNIDRDNEIIPVSAIDVKNFEQNPIILYQHNRNEPVGKAVEIEKREDGLWIKVLISKAATKVRTLIEEGILKAFSVGFRIKDWYYDDNLDVFVYKNIELYETSIVSVPCNPTALFEQVKSFNNELRKDLTSKDNQNPNNTKENKKMDEKLIEMQKELERIKKEKADLEAEKKAKEQAEKEAKLEAERKELKENIKTLTESLETISTAIKDVEAKIEEVKKEYDEKLEEISKQTPRIETTLLDTKEMDEAIEAYKDVLIHNMLFKGERAALDPETFKASKAFAALPERFKSVSLDTQFTTRVHDEILTDIKREASIYPLFREIPSSVTSDTIPFSAQMTASWGTSAPDQSFNPKKVTIDYYSVFSRLDYNYVVDEESIVSWLPFIRQSIIESISSAIDAQILDDTASPSNTFRGLASYAIGASYVYNVADESDLVAADIDGMRAVMGKYGVKPKDIVLVLNSDKYLQIVDDDAVTSVDKFGPNATILTGELGKIRGISILVNDEAVGSSTAASDQYAATLFWKPGFAVKLKSFMVEFDKNITSQTGTLVASARSGFGPLLPLTSNQLTNKIVVVGKNPTS